MIALIQKIRLRWRRSLFITALLLLVVFFTLNVLAYRHAYFMLHYRTNAVSLAPPKFVIVSEKFTNTLLGERIPRPHNTATPADIGLDFETHTIPVDRTTTLQGWWLPQPQAQANVVLFHGYAAAKSNLLSEASWFFEKGYSCFLVDLRGSGDSDGNRTSIGYHEADDVAAVFQYVKKISKEPKILLYGQSMGGAAVMRAIHVHGITPDAIIVESVFDRLPATVKNRVHTMGLPAFPAAHLLVFWGGVQCGYSGFHHNPAEYARSVTCPVLLMQGAKDPWVTVDESKNIYQNLNGLKQYALFEHAAHESCFHRDSMKWDSNMESFLNNIGVSQKEIALAD